MRIPRRLERDVAGHPCDRGRKRSVEAIGSVLVDFMRDQAVRRRKNHNRGEQHKVGYEVIVNAGCIAVA